MATKIKYSSFLLLSLLLSFAFKGVAFACLPLFSFSKADTPSYRLNILESQLPLLKDTVFNNKKCLITHCRLALINNSNDTLKFIAMSTSWWDLYTLNNKNYEFAADYWNVFKNSLEKIVVPPHSSSIKMLPVITFKGYNRGQQLRVGMSLQRLGYELPNINISALERMPKTTNVIWSNAITVR